MEGRSGGVGPPTAGIAHWGSHDDINAIPAAKQSQPIDEQRMSTSGPPGTARRTSAWRRSSRPLAGACVPFLVLAWGCATAGEAPAPAEEGLALGARALAEGDYGEAMVRLREVASRCESGDRGRRAVLLLTTAALDPRNPEASAADGARLAVHFLGLPGSGSEERTVAETLYLLARGYGAPVGDTLPDPGAEAVATLAPRFDHCGAEGDVATSSRALPELPDSSYVARSRAERDRLTARVNALQAELERIRALLREGVVSDTSGARP